MASALTLLLLGAAMPATPVAAAEEKPVAPYRLRAGDEVAVSVLPRKEFDSAGVILPDGMLYLRHVGGLKAEGLTLPELSKRIYEILNVKLVEPRVLATLTRSAPLAEKDQKVLGSITIVGAVQQKGPLELKDGLRVRKAIDLAGGTTPDADLKQVLIVHNDLTQTIVDLSTVERLSDPAHNRVLKDGDSIEIRALPPMAAVEPLTPRVRISGQVVNPGQFDLKNGMTIEDLILAAGKLTPMAKLEEVQLQRNGGEVETIDLKARQNLGLKGKVLLQAGDEVFIPEHKDVVLLIGAITDPGPKALQPGQTVRQFFLDGKADVAAALNPATVNLKGAQLIRRGEEPVKLDLDVILKREKDPKNVTLRAGDVLFLPPKEQKRPGGILQALQGLGPLGLLFSVF